MTYLSVSILTPTGTLAKIDQAEVVVANTTTGQIAILPNHIPLFTRLQHGELKIKAQGKEQFFTLFQGFLNVTANNNIIVMADNALRSEELNVDAIRKAKEDAEKALQEKEKLSATEILKAETTIRRTIMELRIAERKHHTFG
ncbi:ATP synthase F1 subunit epsilon [Candidatus Beckwithbacteria bacterium CG23_combo_of_CG06-09_8_20_14_all_34_8]|uniref:ATP synthase epsilon chain n=1 Tax=Candidatus Beckwithbacteria bacterium CG23_combo_of_CG06-09_8_20_14_all_34_8 TaxID=1974497 RepID=A0A2H0B7C1_9BACT|nr:MAG: ATP synthase F1 subunit epsilon [Candidatus Beckwithbacteria bacterium CG23_combo_of_CG06-09_8_20_14_all_34_8]